MANPRQSVRVQIFNQSYSLLADGEARDVEEIAAQPGRADLWYGFAPLKTARLDYVIQKATEMGASIIQPVITRRTQVSRVQIDRMRANAIEAAEQCGILTLPEVAEPISFGSLMRSDSARLLVFCDEDAPVKDPVAALGAMRPQATALLPAEAAQAPVPLAVLIGPEGGFAEAEREHLLKRPNVVQLSLGPRILRADTAAVAAMALVQAVLGDWRF